MDEATKRALGGVVNGVVQSLEVLIYHIETGQANRAAIATTLHSLASEARVLPGGPPEPRIDLLLMTTLADLLKQEIDGRPRPRWAPVVIEGGLLSQEAQDRSD